ncbi:MAG TPA: hypothetical protein VGR89_08915 [Puia sp.]|nr:hypothetical protein [Puia sp.]
MLNLSDKDLDRLSQEAAQQYEPADVGAKLWEKLEARLDQDLGKVNPNAGNVFRRLHFYYYAPAILLILGVGYYVIRHHRSNGSSSGSPPYALVQTPAADQTTASHSSLNPVNANKQNSTSASSSHTATDADAGTHSGTPVVTANRSAAVIGPGVTSAGNVRQKAADTKRSVRRRQATISDKHAGKSMNGSEAGDTDIAFNGEAEATELASPNREINDTRQRSIALNSRQSRDLTYSWPGSRVRLTAGPNIDDSALRAVTAASIRQPIDRRGGLHVNRSLIFGAHGAADFSSVNSVAGDRAGSTFGLTVDYQFASHAYIGTGVLYSRKIFAATPQDYHVPAGYYNNTMGMGNEVQYIKGRFNMLEIPIDLRYDFSTGDNALLFLSAGTSSYFFTRQDCGYYYLWFNRPEFQKISYRNSPDNLFSTLNLSAGGEFGISNSFSILIAPYIKIPTRNLGFGQVQLTSFGIDFALRFAPVISRKR